MSKFSLGDLATDPVSGFFGTVTAICHYLNADTRVQVTSTVGTDGKINSEWFDIDRLQQREGA